MNIMTILLIVLLVVLLGGGAHYYGPWRSPESIALWPGGLMGVIVLLIILRLLGVI